MLWTSSCNAAVPACCWQIAALPYAPAAQTEMRRVLCPCLVGHAGSQRCLPSLRGLQAWLAIAPGLSGQLQVGAHKHKICKPCAKSLAGPC